MTQKYTVAKTSTMNIPDLKNIKFEHVSKVIPKYDKTNTNIDYESMYNNNYKNTETITTASGTHDANAKPITNEQLKYAGATIVEMTTSVLKGVSYALESLSDAINSTKGVMNVAVTSLLADIVFGTKDAEKK